VNTPHATVPPPENRRCIERIPRYSRILGAFAPRMFAFASAREIREIGTVGFNNNANRRA